MTAAMAWTHHGVVIGRKPAKQRRVGHRGSVAGMRCRGGRVRVRGHSSWSKTVGGGAGSRRRSVRDPVADLEAERYYGSERVAVSQRGRCLASSITLRRIMIAAFAAPIASCCHRGLKLPVVALTSTSSTHPDESTPQRMSVHDA